MPLYFIIKNHFKPNNRIYLQNYLWKLSPAYYPFTYWYSLQFLALMHLWAIHYRMSNKPIIQITIIIMKTTTVPRFVHVNVVLLLLSFKIMPFSLTAFYSYKSNFRVILPPTFLPCSLLFGNRLKLLKYKLVVFSCNSLRDNY